MLDVAPWAEQAAGWPRAGRHLLAQCDAATVIVYQAYRPEIGAFAVEHGFFGGDFSLDRMSWIKPSFLWMMFRSGWASKEGQEVVLAIRLDRRGFDLILAQAVPSSYGVLAQATFDTAQGWGNAVARSDVRLQWDPDHHPSGARLERRAIQPGLRRQVLARYSREWIRGIEDISAFVREQHVHAAAHDWRRLLTPVESDYPVADREVAARLGLEAQGQNGVPPAE